MGTPTTKITRAIYDFSTATFVLHGIVNFRNTASIMGRYIIVKFSPAANSTVRVIVYSTTTGKAVSYIMNMALATNVLTRIVISVATATCTILESINISCATNL